MSPREPHPDLPPHDDPALAHITPDLRATAVPISDLVQDAANLRLHNDRSQEHLIGSYEQFTQRKNVVVQVRHDGVKVVRAGNGTLQALRAMGKEWIAATMVEEDDVTATRFAVADNRTAELSEWDLPSLQLTLDAMEDPIPGVDEQWLEEIKATLDGGDFGTMPDQPEGSDSSSRDSVTVKIKIGSEEHFDDARDALRELLADNPAWKAEIA